MIETKWLKFIEKEPKPKTRVFSVWSKISYCEIGIVHWNPPWRHYSFQPTIKFLTEHSDRCLFSLSRFVKKLNEEHGK